MQMFIFLLFSHGVYGSMFTLKLYFLVGPKPLNSSPTCLNVINVLSQCLLTESLTVPNVNVKLRVCI